MEKKSRLTFEIAYDNMVRNFDIESFCHAEFIRKIQIVKTIFIASLNFRSELINDWSAVTWFDFAGV